MKTISNHTLNKKPSKKGFTIIETLVAIAILMIAITGPLTISQKGLSAAVFARDQLVATYLAQDAMEYVHYMRDKNISSGGAFDTNMSGCATTDGCSVDTYLDGSLVAIDSNHKDIVCQYDNGTAPIYDNGKNGSKCSNGSPFHKDTQFKRHIYIKPVTGPNANNEYAVTVVVTWSNGTLDNTVTLKDNIYNR